MTTAEAMAADVAQIVRGSLRGRNPGGVTLDVVEGGVHMVGDWWHVPIRPSSEPPHTFQYYDALAEIEGELNENTGLRVLLVPALPA